MFVANPMLARRPRQSKELTECFKHHAGSSANICVRMCEQSSEHEVDEYALATKIVKGQHSPDKRASVVHPPVYHASTITFPNMKAFEHASKDPFTGLFYGRFGQPTSWALEEAFAVLEGGYKACAVGSGVAAANASILAFVEGGDHILVSDGVYGPTRTFCDKFLKRFFVEVTYYDPTASAQDLYPLFRPGKTKVLFCESPSSLSFEIQDLPALCQLAHEKGAKVIVDNTYGPTLYQPLAMGADVSYNAATKYIGGHSDLMMGLIACTKQTYRTVKRSVSVLGCPPGPDDCYLALRGLRTLAVRIQQHAENGLSVARWLEKRDEVVRVIHPGLPSHPQHALFKRDFSGSNGLFTFQLHARYSEEDVHRFIDSLSLFSIGYSWGGFESLILKCNINAGRRVSKFKYDNDMYGITLRLHIGLEHVDDLLRDLSAAFVQLNASAGDRRTRSASEN